MLCKDRIYLTSSLFKNCCLISRISGDNNLQDKSCFFVIHLNHEESLVIGSSIGDNALNVCPCNVTAFIYNTAVPALSPKCYSVLRWETVVQIHLNVDRCSHSHMTPWRFQGYTACVKGPKGSTEWSQWQTQAHLDCCVTAFCMPTIPACTDKPFQVSQEWLLNIPQPSL